MKRNFFSLFIVFLIGFLFFVFSSTPVLAQRVGIKMSPVRIEELVDPGEILQEQLKVTNESDITKTLYAYLKDFKAEGEFGKPKLIAPGSEQGSFLASWISITKKGIDFLPGEEKIIPLTIKVPKNVGPGGYYGAIFFGTVPPRLRIKSEGKGAGMAVAQQTGSLILLQVKGNVKEEARVRQFTVNKSVYSTPFNINFLVRIENLGNVHLQPHGNIDIFNMFNKKVKLIPVNAKIDNILPHSIRRFLPSWQGNMGFGRYRASLNLTYGTPVKYGGQGQQSLYTETYFWIMPWRIIIPSLIGIIFIIAVFILLLRLYRNKAVKKAMEKAGLGHIRYVKKYEGPSPVLHLSLILLIVFVILFLIIGFIYLFFLA